jgi:glycosyltransferase involved in cell wall biosynthesis
MKTKILYIHHDGSFSGAPKSMSYIIKKLDQKKHTPYLLNIQNGPIDDFFKTLPCQIISSKKIRPFHGSTVVEKSFRLFIRNWVFLLPSIIRANNVLKIHKPDLIHLNSTCLFPFAIAAKMNEISVVCHVREPLRIGLWGAPLRFFCKKFVDGFIAICENDLNSLKISKNNNKTKKEVIYNFVDYISEKKVKENFAFKQELKISNDAIVFLYLARFAKSNGWEELIEMAKKSILENPNFHFVLVGASSPNHFKKVESKNIHILPFRQDIENIMNGSDIFVCPFTEPHFARGVIEASAYGLPIIGANIGGVDELVIHSKTGFLYKNEKDFIHYCNLLGKDESLRDKFGDAGIINVKKKFEQEENLKKTYNFYGNFINKL